MPVPRYQKLKVSLAAFAGAGVVFGAAFLQAVQPVSGSSADTQNPAAVTTTTPATSVTGSSTPTHTATNSPTRTTTPKAVTRARKSRGS